MGDTGKPEPAPRSRARKPLRGHLPFAVFLAALTAYCAYLQVDLAGLLPRLYLVRIFFQVALAALVVATMRNLLGIKTLGMFSVVIIALAFLATGLLLGLALFGVILAVVMLARGALIAERVQGAHRIAILVTIVSITIASVVLLGVEIGQHELFFAVLFPVLISAWMAERYVERVTRVGWDEPTETLGWTLAAIVLAFAVVTFDPLVNAIELNPLTWPLLVFLNWLLGTRIRFRLSERYRFGGVSTYALGDHPAAGDFADDVLTMNTRNRDYVAVYNPPAAMARLSKEGAKALLVPQGIPMARTYLVLHSADDLAPFRAFLASHDRFVLKPGSGHGGEGILLVHGKRDGGYETGEGLQTAKALEAHALRILDGEYGGDQRDVALVEELLTPHPAIQDLSPIGLADIRVISFLGYPVMAMLRIPTRASGGKANLHLGAVGAGIRLSTGTIVHCVLHGLPQPEHPDTGQSLPGARVPFWDEVLEIAAEAQHLSGLGFAGVDIAIDATRGAVVMEVNRRPGLEIQNANAAGLRRRLRAIALRARSELAVEDRIAIARNLDEANWGLPSSARGAPRPSGDGSSVPGS